MFVCVCVCVCVCLSVCLCDKYKTAAIDFISISFSSRSERIRKIAGIENKILLIKYQRYCLPFVFIKSMFFTSLDVAMESEPPRPASALEGEYRSFRVHDCCSIKSFNFISHSNSTFFPSTLYSFCVHSVLFLFPFPFHYFAILDCTLSSHYFCSS